MAYLLGFYKKLMLDFSVSILFIRLLHNYNIITLYKTEKTGG